MFLPRSIPNHIRRDRVLEIAAQMYLKNTSAAFILPENDVENILGRDDMIENGQNLFRAINFTVGKQKVGRGVYRVRIINTKRKSL